MMCMRCRRTAHPKALDGWAHLLMLIHGDRETRGLGWLCPDCMTDLEKFIYGSGHDEPGDAVEPVNPSGR